MKKIILCFSISTLLFLLIVVASALVIRHKKSLDSGRWAMPPMLMLEDEIYGTYSGDAYKVMPEDKKGYEYVGTVSAEWAERYPTVNFQSNEEGLCGFGIYKHPDYPGIIYVMNGDDKFELFEKMSKEKQDEIQNEIQKGIHNEIYQLKR